VQVWTMALGMIDNNDALSRRASNIMSVGVFVLCVRSSEVVGTFPLLCFQLCKTIVKD